MSPALSAYIQAQQDIGHKLSGVMAALDLADDDGQARNAVTALIRIGRELAESLSDGLDSVNLPDGRETA